jgi:hypothetical protein
MQPNIIRRTPSKHKINCSQNTNIKELINIKQLLNQFLFWLHDDGKDEKTITAYKTTINQFLTWYMVTNEKINFKNSKTL